MSDTTMNHCAVPRRNAATAELLASWAGSQARFHDNARRLTPATAERITVAGFPAHFVPRRWGGGEGSFAQLVDAVVDVSARCTSTGWCAALFAAHGRLAAYLPEEGQRVIWDEGPHVRIAAAVLPPAGTAVEDGSGWTLSGRWSLASGVDHADWVLLGSMTEGTHRIFAVPRKKCRIVDTWDQVGLRGTGSNSVEADKVHVPRSATVTLAELAQTRTAPELARCHQVPFPLVASVIFASPVLGAACGALESWTRSANGKDLSATRAAALTRSSGEIQAASLLLRTAADRADFDEVTPLAAAENTRDAALAADLCVTAVERLFRTVGARSQGADQDIERQWRDVHAAASHATLAFETAAARYIETVLPA